LELLKRAYHFLFFIGIFFIPFNSDIPKFLGFLGEYSADSSPYFFMVSLLLLVIYQLLKGKIFIPFKTVEYQIFLCFILVLFIATIFNIDHIFNYYFKKTSGPIRLIRQTLGLLIGSVFFFYTFVNVCRDYGAVRFFYKIRKLFFISFIIVLFVGALEFAITTLAIEALNPFYRIFNFLPFVEVSLDYKMMRLSSITYEPPALGTYLITIVGFMFSYIITEKKLTRFLPFLCVVILAILSKSRTAMVVILVQAIVAFFLAYYYYKDFRKYFNRVIVFGLAATIVISFIYKEPLSAAIEERVASLNFTKTKFKQSSNSISNKSRLGIQVAMIETIKRNPLLGTGWGQQAYVSKNHYPNWAVKNNYEFSNLYLNQNVRSFPPGFNLYLRIAAESGILGLIVFAYFLYVTVKNLIYWLRNDKKTKYITIALLISFSGFILNWLQIDSFRIYGFWLCLAIFIILKKELHGKKNNSLNSSL
tara:strand:+ start:1446 stop:2873 length:1428 start_codon:yes stop_codon:yes gene_type:complete